MPTFSFYDKVSNETQAEILTVLLSLWCQNLGK